MSMTGLQSGFQQGCIPSWRLWRIFYWAGRKTREYFSLRCYGKTRMNFFTNPIFSCFYSFKKLPYQLFVLSFTHDAGKDWGQEEKGTTEDEMVGWHHWLNGHEFEQAPGVGDGQRSLVCCSPWGHKESDRTEWLNNNIIYSYRCCDNTGPTWVTQAAPRHLHANWWGILIPSACLNSPLPFYKMYSLVSEIRTWPLWGGHYSHLPQLPIKFI